MYIGNTEIRTCNQYQIDDCKTANRVTYCYCNTDRCNGKSQKEISELTMLEATSTIHRSPGRIGINLPDSDIDDDEGGDDDEEEENFDGSGLESTLTTLNSFNANGLPRPTSKEESTSSISTTTTPPLPSTETEIYSQLTTASPNNNVRHRNSSQGIGIRSISFIYFVCIPAFWIVIFKQRYFNYL